MWWSAYLFCSRTRCVHVNWFTIDWNVSLLLKLWLYMCMQTNKCVCLFMFCSPWYIPLKIIYLRLRLNSLLRRHSLGFSCNLPPPWLQQTFVGDEDCVTSPKNVCLGGYRLSECWWLSSIKYFRFHAIGLNASHDWVLSDSYSPFIKTTLVGKIVWRIINM